VSLRDWQRNSWLVEHKNSREEITALLAIVGISITLRLESIRHMQIGIARSDHMWGAMAPRLAMLRNGFGGHAVAAKDAKP